MSPKVVRRLTWQLQARYAQPSLRGGRGEGDTKGGVKHLSNVARGSREAKGRKKPLVGQCTKK